VHCLPRKVIQKRDHHCTCTKFQLWIIRWVHELCKRPAQLDLPLNDRSENHYMNYNHLQSLFLTASTTVTGKVNDNQGLTSLHEHYKNLKKPVTYILCSHTDYVSENTIPHHSRLTGVNHKCVTKIQIKRAKLKMLISSCIISYISLNSCCPEYILTL